MTDLKRQTSVRLSKRTDRQIAELTEEFGCTMAELLAWCIDQAWQKVEEENYLQAVAEAQREAARLINEEE